MENKRVNDAFQQMLKVLGHLDVAATKDIYSKLETLEDFKVSYSIEDLGEGKINIRAGFWSGCCTKWEEVKFLLLGMRLMCGAVKRYERQTN